MTTTATPAPARTRRPGAVWWAAAVLLGAVALVVTVPEWFGLDVTRPFAELVSARPYLAAGLLMAGAALAPARRARPVAAALAAVGLLAAVLVLPRALPPGPAPLPAPAGAPPLTVLSLNVHDGAAEVGPLAGLIAAERPDLVVLPEAGEHYRRSLAPRTDALGYRSFTSTPDGVRDREGTTVLAAPRLGAVTAAVPPVRTMFRWLEVRGGGLGELRVLAAHPAAPLPHLVRRWAADVEALRGWCGPDAAPALVVGDLNATLDHRVLRAATPGCSDAAASRGKGLVATWPSSWPRWSGVQIDHVLAGRGLVAEDVRVLDAPGSDHRALLVRFAPTFP